MSEQVEQTVRDFFSAYPDRKWDAGRTIIDFEEEPEGIYYIESGEIRQYVINQKGDQLNVNLYREKTFIPMMWAFNREPLPFIFETTQDSVLRCAPADDVLRLLKDHPEVMYDLLGRMYAGLSGLLERVAHMMGDTAYVRLVHELLLLIKREHGGKVIHMKEYEIAMFCGLSKETISREMKQLKDKNILTISGDGIHIHDIQALENELRTATS